VRLVGLVAAGLSLLVAAGALPSPASANGVASPVVDEEIRRALDLLYDGFTDAALERFRALVAADPGDPLALYFQALALCWKIEQRPETTAGDAELQTLIDRVLALTAAGDAPTDAPAPRARLARGGAFGVRSRLALFRRDSRAAARAAAAMRAELLPLRAHESLGADAEFGVGLYDYYADVLPRAAKVLRFFLGLPGGDRARGLAAIESARAGSAFHGVEAAVQLYEIDVYYEDAPDRALTEIRQLHARYPRSPLWALKLAEHLRERLGRYAESAVVAREILTAAERGDSNFGPGAAALARLAYGECLLLDLRPAEARQALIASFDGLAPESTLRARLLVGRTFELERERAEAIPYYRAASHATDPEVRQAAERAVARPLPETELRAFPHLAAARRLREAGRVHDSAEAYRRALGAWDECLEARLRVAEDDIHQGRLAEARDALRILTAAARPSPPWVGAWTRLLRAYVEDAAPRRTLAVKLYKQVLYEPLGDPDLVREATLRLRVPFRIDPTSSAPPQSSNN
jgi:hypothetical protein